MRLTSLYISQYTPSDIFSFYTLLNIFLKYVTLGIMS